MFIGLIIMAMFFTWFSGRRSNILIAFAAFLLWFSTGMWLFFSTAPPLTLGEPWTDLLAWFFVIMAFVPWLLQMNVEIRHEAEGHSWSSFGKEPERKTPSEYEDYRDKLYNRTRRR